MWTSIGKLEIKKGLLYYLLLYLFFFFWSFFTLFAFFIYTNVKYLSETFISQRGISILFYPQKNHQRLKDIRETLNQLPYIKEVRIVSPKELLQTLENQLPKEILEEKDLPGWFPYLIKVYLSSPEKFSQLKSDLQIWQKMTYGGLELISEPLQKNIFLWQYSNFALLIFLLLWNLFYFLFFYFVARTLIHHLKEHNEIFQLLGGNIFHLFIIRFLILALPLFLLFLTSFLVYYLLIGKFIYYFPILKTYPPHNNHFEIFFLIIYFFFLIIVYPVFLLIFFLKRT